MNSQKIRDYLIPILVVSLLGWATWITTSIYAEDKKGAVTAGKMEAVSEKIKKIEEDVKEIKSDVKEQTEQTHKNQVETMKLLMEIKKETRK